MHPSLEASLEGTLPASNLPTSSLTTRQPKRRHLQILWKQLDPWTGSRWRLKVEAEGQVMVQAQAQGKGLELVLGQKGNKLRGHQKLNFL